MSAIPLSADSEKENRYGRNKQSFGNWELGNIVLFINLSCTVISILLWQIQRQEFKWLIKNEVHKVFGQLKEILDAAARRYPVEIPELETQVRQEKYVMATSTQTSQDQLKCILTITGDSITAAVWNQFF